MDSQDSHVSPLQRQSNDSIPTQFPNTYSSFNLPFQSTIHVDARNDAYFPHINHPHSSQFSYQTLLNNPNFPFEESPTPTPTPIPPKGRKTKVRDAQNSNSQTCANPNWSKAEDVALTKSWLYVSVDADVGNGQRNAAMWNRILETWKDNMGAECKDVRNINSLGCRWKRIQQDVSKFHACYERLERQPRSGTNPEDMKREAMRMFEDCNDNRQFKFEHCWEILKSNAKWCTTQLTKMNQSNKQQSHNGNSSTTYENVVNLGDEYMTSDGINSDEIVRPQGRKASKEKKRRLHDGNGVVDVLKQLHNTMEKQIEINQKELELKREKDTKQFEMREQTLRRDLELRERAQKMKEQHRIMNQDLSKLTPSLRETYEIYQAKILKEWENDGLFGNDFPL